MKLYTIYDNVAESTGPLFEAKNDEVAKRKVIQMMPEVAIPSDYELFCVGEINHESHPLDGVCIRPDVYLVCEVEKLVVKENDNE